MSAHVTPKDRLHLAAMAVLVADDVVTRDAAVDCLTHARANRRLTREQREALPKGYGTARQMALLLDRGDVNYSEAEHNVAFALSGGKYGGDFGHWLCQAGHMLSEAIKRLDALRGMVSGELQAAIAEARAPVTDEALAGVGLRRAEGAAEVVSRAA